MLCAGRTKGCPWIILAELRAEAEDHPPPGYPYSVVGHRLAVGLVYDFPESMSLIQQCHLDAWDVSFDEAMHAACDNLLQITDKFLTSEDAGVYVSVRHDSYDAARFILTDLLGEFDVEDDLVAMVPNRNTLIVTGTDDAEGLVTMVLHGDIYPYRYRATGFLTGTQLRAIVGNEFTTG